MTVAEVALTKVTLAVEKAYKYIVPTDIQVTVGVKVSVPFGKRKGTGYVLSVGETDDVTGLKSIAELLPERALSPEQFDLGLFISDRFFSTKADAFGVICPVPIKTFPPEYATVPYSADKLPELSDEQTRVLHGLTALALQGKPDCALLRGVTGSGKTFVFIRLIAEVISHGRNAILLVPEINLTPQTLNKFSEYFGGIISVLHSGITAAAKRREYARIESGNARLIIGTRSAIFAPLPDIGVIVIDEEHDRSYKSDKSPRYHARDVAKFRAVKHNALLLLASATPEIDSYYRALSGVYKLFELHERYGGAVLPQVYTIDMGRADAYGAYAKGRTAFTIPLLNAIKHTLDKGEQSLILLNRRGYNTTVSCAECGKTADCPTCLLPLTYHADGSLRCHRCGYVAEYKDTCEYCHGRVYKTGTGTQRAAEQLETELHRSFPTARILRADTDTLKTAADTEKYLTAFANGEYDIAVGTQMLSKGHNFPKVTLVGVLLTDKLLYGGGDYKQFERTFELLTQVTGRAGRNTTDGQSAGSAYIQTYSPDHYVITLACKQDYTAFFNEELTSRKLLSYPPYSILFRAVFKSADEQKAANAAAQFTSDFERTAADTPHYCYPPMKAEYGRINGEYKYAVDIKGTNSRQFRALIRGTVANVTGVSAYVDIV
ncbi:MAG: primosomal protein N' [Oscillospiraceae bacterium]|jgi:primosomal protein N' (replication factor Y)|nr:primosomal protein N' [Oscillospiraceae bacterium]